MKRTRKLRMVLAIAAVIVVAAVGWFVYSLLYTVDHIPEAYAAWDTGTLLVEYMEVHGNRWPTSWDELLTVMNSDADRQILLRGGHAGESDLAYARTLQDKVSIDRTF